MIVLFEHLKKSIDSSKIAFICKNSYYLSTFIPDAKILTQEEQKKVTAELFIYGGGTQFFSFQDNRPLYRKLMSVLKQTLKIIEHKKRYNYTASIGIGIGSFFDRATEFVTRLFFVNMDYISTRDVSSSNYINKWNISHAKQFTDICYLIKNKKAIQTKKTIEKVGIIVRDWNHTKNSATYYKSILKLFTQLENKGYKPTLIVFSEKSDSYWMSKIHEFKNVLIWKPNNNTVVEFMDRLNKFDIFVTARFHGAIFSSLLSKPFIGINVEKRLDTVADEYTGLSKKWSHPFNVQQCIKLIIDINDSYEKYNNVRYECFHHIETANHMKEDFTKFLNEIFT